jgi:hypothetical protein
MKHGRCARDGDDVLEGLRANVRQPRAPNELLATVGIESVREQPGSKRVQRVEVDPRRALPDVDRGNNVWPRS